MKPVTEQNNIKAIQALNRLSYMDAMEKRIESVYKVKMDLGRLGFTKELEQVCQDNVETQEEMIERFITF